MTLMDKVCTVVFIVAILPVMVFKFVMFIRDLWLPLLILVVAITCLYVGIRGLECTITFLMTHGPL